tara:strand:+ start:103 stop:633 length:531 start_codon:yes stop_codon:yes gene_type:complete
MVSKNKMNGQEFEKLVESKLGDYKKLPSYPFMEEFSYAVFPGAEDGFVDEKFYAALLNVNSKFGSNQLLIKPHFAGSNEEHLFLKQDLYDWKAFNEMQNEHLTCEGIYFTGNNFDWLGIYHYDDYLIVGAKEPFIKELCGLVYKDSDWKKHFSDAFKNGEISMYQSDYEALVEKLF